MEGGKLERDTARSRATHQTYPTRLYVVGMERRGEEVRK